MNFTKHNFMNNSFGIFKGCKKPKRKPNYVSYSKYDNSISSEYWYGSDKKGDFVIRASDHWANYKPIGKNNFIEGCINIASCKWNLKTTKIKIIKEESYIKKRKYRLVLKKENYVLCGKCYIQDFIKNTA